MAGDGLVRPWYSAPAADLRPGVQPGATSPVVVANKVVIVGTGGELLVYTAPAGPNQLVASISGRQFTDSFGNSVLPGITSYSPVSAGIYYALNESAAGLTWYYGTSQAAWPFTLGQLSSSGTSGALLSHSALAISTVGFGTSISGSVQFAGDPVGGNAVMALLNSSYQGYLPVEKTDTANHTNSGATSSAVAISAAYTIPAGDMQNGTVYVLEVPYTGIQEGQTVTWGISVDGGSPVAQDGIGAAFFTAGSNFVGTVRGRVRVAGTGTAAPVLFYLDGGVGISGTRSSGANNNNAYLSGIGTGGTINTTVSHTFAITAQFGGVSAGQTVVGYGSVFSRKGP